MICVGNRHFSASVIEWLISAVKRTPSLSRTALSEELCRRSDWRNQKGELCSSQARRALPELCSKLEISLSPVERKNKKKRGDLGDLSLCKGGVTDREHISLESLGKIELKLVKRHEEDEWHAFLQEHHDLGPNVKSKGKKLKYFVWSQHQGLVAVISFVAADWHVKARDKYIGWCDEARTQDNKLDTVLNNDRFAVRSDTKVYGLTSLILNKARDAIIRDWPREKGCSALLLYTYIRSGRGGTCYKKAGWKNIGRTSGRRDPDGIPKKVFVLPLAEDFQDILCTYRKINPFLMPNGIEYSDTYKSRYHHWGKFEYAFGEHPDGRLKKIIKLAGEGWLRRPYDNIPQKFPEESMRKRVRRLICNERVGVNYILRSHYRATAYRCIQKKEVLVPQGTNILDLDSSKRSIDGPVAVGHSQGLPIHLTSAFAPEGEILGTIKLDGDDTRRLPDMGKSLGHRWVNSLEATVDIAKACPDTRFINISDCEGDDWACYEYLEENKHPIGHITRSHVRRQRQVIKKDGDTENLHEYMRTLDTVGSYTMTLAAHGGNKRRPQEMNIEVHLRIARVTVKAPKQGDHKHSSLSKIVVLASSDFALPQEEQEGSSGDQIILDSANKTTKNDNEWVLISSEGEATYENAKDLVDKYARRWRIEELFRTLKTCSDIEGYKFNTIERINKCIAFDVVTANQIMGMLYMAKYTPRKHWSTVMEKDDLYALIMTLRATGLSKLVTHEMTEFVERFFENTIDNNNKTQKDNQKKNKLKPEQILENREFY